MDYDVYAVKCRICFPQSLLCFHIFQLKIEYLEYLQLFQQHLLHSVCVFVVDGDNFQYH